MALIWSSVREIQFPDHELIVRFKNITLVLLFSSVPCCCFQAAIKKKNTTYLPTVQSTQWSITKFCLRYTHDLLINLQTKIQKSTSKCLDNYMVTTIYLILYYWHINNFTITHLYNNWDYSPKYCKCNYCQISVTTSVWYNYINRPYSLQSIWQRTSLYRLLVALHRDFLLNGNSCGSVLPIANKHIRSLLVI